MADDVKSWEILQAFRADDAGESYDLPYALFQPRPGWVFPYGHGASLLHRLTVAMVVWIDADRYRLGARTACGKTFAVSQLFAEPPDGHYCDNCLLGADYVVWGVYRFFDKDKALLYIGSTNRLDRRIEWHRTKSDWWWQVTSHTFDPYPDEFSARTAERRAIDIENPRHNGMRAKSQPALTT